MSRAEDIRIEQVCGKFLDENFYSKLGCKFERNSVLSSQYLGVDVTIFSQHGTFVIDEKVKYYGTINKAIDCPSFEITRRDRAGNRSIGWYASGKQLTNTYLFISPFLAEGDQPQQITDDNLSALQILMVPKKSVSQLAKSCQLSDIDIIERAEALADDVYLNWQQKAYDRIAPNKLWLTYSAGLREQPVNMVVPRDVLKQLKGVADLLVTKDGIKRV